MLLQNIVNLFLGNSKSRESDVIRAFPKSEWAVGFGAHFVSRNYHFIAGCTKQTNQTLYIYSIKEFPNLLKIGITDNINKRHEPYYGELLYSVDGSKEKMIFIEFCIKHATYHLANKSLPRWNVGNLQEDNFTESLNDFYNKFPSVKGRCSGHTEVREITLEVLIELVEFMLQIYEESSKRKLYNRFAIKEFVS